MDVIEKTRRVLQKHNGNKAAAARELGVTRQTVQNRMSKLPIQRVPQKQEVDWENRDVNKICERYLPLVESVARKLYASSVVDIDDLKSDGFLGLREAVIKFDPKRGYAFPTYAVRRIRGAMIDGIRKLDPVPRLRRGKEKERKQFENAFQKEEGRIPTPEEVKSALNWTDEDYKSSITPYNISANLIVDNPAYYKSTEIFDQVQPTVLHEQPLDVEQNIKHILRGLNPEEIVIMYLYHWKEITMKEIGHVLHLSESRISQMHSQILERVKKRIGEEGIRNPRSKTR